jgi:hypothetical protein
MVFNHFSTHVKGLIIIKSYRDYLNDLRQFFWCLSKKFKSIKPAK